MAQSETEKDLRHRERGVSDHCMLAAWLPKGLLLVMSTYNRALLAVWSKLLSLESLCCPDRSDGWFGCISSTRTATLRMRLGKSCGSESSTSSITLTKCSRFISHPLKERASLLRVAVVGFVVIIFIFFAVALVLVFFFLILFLVRLLSQETLAVTRAAAWLESSGSHLCLSNCRTALEGSPAHRQSS